MRAVHVVWLPVVAAVGVAIACGDASQTPVGGDPLFDASFPITPQSDGGATCIASDASNVTWTSIYADLIGPASIGQCGDPTRTGANGTTSCHHDSSGNGALSSGFVCGDTQGSCYEGITSTTAVFAGTQVVATCDPQNSYLSQVLRHDGGGIMPFYPETVVFSDDQMARVTAWIAAGALDN